MRLWILVGQRFASLLIRLAHVEPPTYGLATRQKWRQSRFLATPFKGFFSGRNIAKHSFVYNNCVCPIWRNCYGHIFVCSGGEIFIIIKAGKIEITLGPTSEDKQSEIASKIVELLYSILADSAIEFTFTLRRRDVNFDNRTSFARNYEH